METVEIKGVLRESTGKAQNKQLRKDEMAPCVMYGGKENLLFSVDTAAFRKILSFSATHVIKVDIAGKVYTTILQDVQFHPVTDEVLHADFLEISENKPITVKLPIVLSGHSIGVREGGKLVVGMRKVKVKGLVNDLPNEVKLDITDLAIGKSIRAGEIEMDKVAIVELASAPIVTVKATRASNEAKSE